MLTSFIVAIGVLYGYTQFQEKTNSIIEEQPISIEVMAQISEELDDEIEFMELQQQIDNELETNQEEQI